MPQRDAAWMELAQDQCTPCLRRDEQALSRATKNLQLTCYESVGSSWAFSPRICLTEEGRAVSRFTRRGMFK